MRRTARAQSSSCSQMEMKLAWRSIYTQLRQKKTLLVYPVGEVAESTGRQKITWSNGERKEAFRCPNATDQSSVRKAGTNNSKVFLSRMETQKLRNLRGRGGASLTPLRHFDGSKSAARFFISKKHEQREIDPGMAAKTNKQTD